MKKAIGVATVALGSVLSPANAQQSHVERISPGAALVAQSQVQDPPFDPFQKNPTPQAQGSQGNKSSVDLDVCIGGSVIIGGGLAAAIAARRNRDKPEGQKLRESRDRAEEWAPPERDDRRR